MVNIEDTLDITFKKRQYLEQALVHSSYVNENLELAPVSNERLEFLGDAVLGLIIGEMLYRNFPQYDEGEMTRIRASLVRGDTLARIAEAINLGDFLVLGKGETATGGRQKPANLAAAMEAVIAAIYLDQGLTVTGQVVRRLFASEIERALQQDDVTDYKSKLQEIIQGKYQQTPSYHLIAEDGPDHRKTFTAEVRLGDTVLGQGTGRSKKAAEAEAARIALEGF